MKNEHSSLVSAVCRGQNVQGGGGKSAGTAGHPELGWISQDQVEQHNTLISPEFPAASTWLQGFSSAVALAASSVRVAAAEAVGAHWEGQSDLRG